MKTGKTRKYNELNKKNNKRKLDPYVKKFIDKCNAITKCKFNKCQLPYIQVDLGVTSTLGLIDSGSTRSLISQQLADTLAEHNLVKRSQTVNIKCATANKQNLIIKLSITIKLKIKNLTWYFPMLVCDELGPDLILGADFISKTGIILDIHDKKYYFGFDRTQKYSFDCETNNSKNNGTAATHLEHHESELTHLESKDRLKIQKLINEFATVLTPKLGLTNLIEYKINLSDNKVIRLHPYKLSPPKMETMRNQINKLLEQEVIEPSTSPYSSPAFLVPKGHDKHRLVVDYRQLNKNIEFESIPLPDIHSAFHYFTKAKVFTIMDLNQAFHQIPLSEESKRLTAFAVPFNLYQFKRVPFGISQGSSAVSYTHLDVYKRQDTPAQLGRLSELDYESERETCYAKYWELTLLSQTLHDEKSPAVILHTTQRIEHLTRRMKNLLNWPNVTVIPADVKNLRMRHYSSYPP